jgi:hypothetical protein
MKLNALKFAVAGGLSLAIVAELATLASLLGIPGYPQFTRILTDIYGAYGYSVSAVGLLAGALLGFVEGFVHLGLLALLYNTLIDR